MNSNDNLNNELKNYEKYSILKTESERDNFLKLADKGTVDYFSTHMPATLVVSSTNHQYEIENVTQASDIKNLLNSYSFLEDTDIYLIPQQNALDIKNLSQILKTEYKKYYDSLHPNPILNFFKINQVKYTLYALITFSPFILMLAMKYEWINLGLPLESWPKGNIVEDYLNILMMLLMKMLTKELFVAFCISISIILFFLVSDWIKDKEIYPSVKRHFYFYFNRVLTITLTLLIFWYTAVMAIYFYQQFNGKNNALIKLVLDLSLYPKIVTINSDPYVISHMEGKYAYIQLLDINISQDINCSNNQQILDSFSLHKDNYTAYDYGDLNVSSIESPQEFCEKTKPL